MTAPPVSAFTAAPDWVIRPTAIVRKMRRGAARVLLLCPPPGYTGRIRLGVISGRHRAEFVATWLDGRLGPGDRTLDAFFSGDPALAPPRWPALAAARLDPRARPADARVDLYMEDAASAAAPLTGQLRLPPPPPAALLYVAPRLPDPGAAAKAPELLGAALKALGKNRDLRLSMPEAWAELIQSHGHGARVRELARGGRLELLHTDDTVAAAVANLGLPRPTRLGLGGISSAGGLRGLLLEPPDATLPPGSAGRLAGEDRDVPVYGLPSLPTVEVFSKELSSYAAVLIDRLLGAAARQAVGRQRPAYPPGKLETEPPVVRGFLSPVLEDPDALRTLGGALRRWNREHLTPRMLPATPSDFLSALSELHAQRLISLPRI